MSPTGDTDAPPIDTEDLSNEALMALLPWLARFISAYRNSGVFRAAFEAAGTDRRTAMAAIEAYPQVAELVADAELDARDILEAEARRRAMGGSDGLLEFLLKGAWPEKYGERVKVDIAENTRRMAREAGLTPEETEEAVIEAESILLEQRRRNRFRI
jgi:hypothetical protein